LGTYIEQEKKIQEQLQLTNYDLILSKNILNFYTPPPVIQPAIEVANKDRFLIADLIRLRHELESLSDSLSRIESKDLLNFLITMQRYRPLARLLPPRWTKLGAADFEQLIAQFDPQLTGKIPTNHLFTLVCLQNSSLPKDLSLADYRARLEAVGSKGKVSCEEFVAMPAFFDASQEQKKQYDRSNKFNRVYHLKRLLFEVNGDTTRVDNSDQRTRWTWAYSRTSWPAAAWPAWTPARPPTSRRSSRPPLTNCLETATAAKIRCLQATL
jgi:hypothetical protein